MAAIPIYEGASRIRRLLFRSGTSLAEALPSVVHTSAALAIAPRPQRDLRLTAAS